MRIVRSTTGVDAVTVPDDQIVFVDPRLSYEEAVAAVWGAAPKSDPAEVRRLVREAVSSPEGSAPVDHDATPSQTGERDVQNR